MGATRESSWSAESMRCASLGGGAEGVNAYAKRSPGPIASAQIMAILARIARRLPVGGLRFIVASVSFEDFLRGARQGRRARARRIYAFIQCNPKSFAVTFTCGTISRRYCAAVSL